MEMSLRTCSTCDSWNRTWTTPNKEGVLESLCTQHNKSKTGSEKCSLWAKIKIRGNWDPVIEW
jgi:hypothetical protein